MILFPESSANITLFLIPAPNYFHLCARKPTFRPGVQPLLLLMCT